MNYNKGSLTARSNTPSVSSYRSSVTGRTRTTSASRTNRSIGSRGTEKASLDKTGQIIELDDPDSEFGALNATGMMFDLLQKAVRIEECLENLLSMIFKSLCLLLLSHQKRKKDKNYFPGGANDVDGIKGEFELLQDQLNKASKDLRGKKFILDRYGQPIPIGSVDPKRLPALTTPLNLQVKEPTPSNASGRRTSNNSQRPGTQHLDQQHQHQQHQQQQQQQQQQKKRQFVRVAGSRGVDEASFMPTLSLATTLSGVETIPKVNPGVVVRSTVAVKAGDTIAEDPKHVSRKALQSRAQQQTQLGGLGGHSQIQNGSTYSSTASLHNRHPPQSLTVGFQDSAFQGADDEDDNGRVNVAASLASLPDFNPLEGSRKLAFADVSHDLSDADLGLGPYDGGASPSSHQQRLPQKPGARQEHNIRLLRGSPEHGKPKDRDAPKNIHPVALRKHLPAPPLGQTTGHGLTLEKFHEKSSLQSDSRSQFNMDGDNTSAEWHQQWRG